jgi:hypothetical protein
MSLQASERVDTNDQVNGITNHTLATRVSDNWLAPAGATGGGKRPWRHGDCEAVCHAVGQLPHVMRSRTSGAISMA